ncbi:ABC1 family protein C21C3.03, mitochondrial [Seminavis robusta]|uniref:ABC1 family protein C21C3.03, mitochondrial n=1 Tax=Seminavis robusta TaxID=568900 RepID=A0A9N8HTU3_9STRA|nr:ABC1 family protein C21C3.03, mitochondrial [Seminavis robusta]|eukprot:Sro1943_g306820.1 ABC1 family protein C21C3.03, mitochondrial (738) ;mRNA; f:5344-7852
MNMATLTNTRQRWLLLWLLLASPTAVVARGPAFTNKNKIIALSAGAIETINNNDEIHTHDTEIGRMRTSFVRHILSDRLHYVKNGRRMKDFKAWLRSRGGEVAVLSTHGVEVDLQLAAVPSQQNNNNIEEQQLPPVPAVEEYHYNEDLVRAAVIKNNDPFAVNKLDLDLPVNNLPSLYEGEPIHLMDELSPSLLQLSWRTIQLSFKFAPVLSTTWLAVLSTKFRKTWYKWVAASLGTTSAAFIKWGQWAATRNDMFPDLLCQELELLQSSAPEHSWSFSEKMMESSLGLPADSLMDVFDSFDEKPLASGSIAQVHKAELDGKPVAVKIRHPRVAQLIDMDFRIMTAFATICDWIPALSWLHIRESVEQFSHTMAAQAHLQVEAHHLEILNHNFRKWPTVKFPHPIYASSAVIIETFEPGIIVSDMMDAYSDLANQYGNKNKNNQNNDQRVTVVEEDGQVVEQDTTGRPSASDLIPVDTAKFIVCTGVGLYLKMLLVDNLMHADLHPGNIMLAAIAKGQCPDTDHDMDLLVVKDTESKALAQERAETKLRICLVDAGMVAQLTDQEATNFIGLLASLGQGDGRLAAKFALKFSTETDLTAEEKESFTEDMIEVFAERCRGYFTGADVGHILRGVLGLIRKHKVRIDANYATLVVNVLCIQSLALQVCPAYNVLDAAKPLLQSYFDTFFEPDGEEKPRAKAVAKFNRIMPIKYLEKSRNDNAFFRRIKQARQAQMKLEQ